MESELIGAAERGDTAEVTRLLKEGAHINDVDQRGRTAALAAVHGNRPETLKVLIAAGADINLRDQRSDNPLLYAGAEGLPEMVRLAVEAGADTTLTNRYGGTALIPAADRGHADIVQYLLEHSDVNVNHVNNLGWTALLEAVILGDGGNSHTRIVRLLTRHGADVNLADKDGVTPLSHAEQRGYAEITAILKEAGAR